MYKQRLSPSGDPVSQAERHLLKKSGVQAAASNSSSNSSSNATAACGTCYGAEDADHPCCNTCDEVGGW